MDLLNEVAKHLDVTNNLKASIEQFAFLCDSEKRIPKTLSEKMANMSTDSTVHINGQAENCSINMLYKPEYLNFSTENINLILNIGIVEEIERELDFHEKVSLIFLIYEDSDLEYALQCLLLCLNNRNNNKSLIADYFRFERKDWRIKLLEGLTIIECFHIISKLGFKKCHVIDHFFSKNNEISRNISVIRKKLYKFCENLNRVETCKLMNSFRQDNEQAPNAFSDYLEISLLYLMSRKQISFFEEDINLDYLITQLKKVELFSASDELKTCKLLNEYENSNHTNSTLDPNIELNYNDNSLIAGVNNNKDYYVIKDPSNVGVCLIINQKHFQELQGLNRLGERRGTEADVSRLVQTFEKYNFEVIVKNDIKNVKEMGLSISEVVLNTFKRSQHSLFFLVILSHGKEGAVYGTDSHLIPITKVEQFVLQYLPSFPKVIIIQACQGDWPNPVLETDGKGETVSNITSLDDIRKVLPGFSPRKDNINPTYCDLLKWYSSVPGFESYRDTHYGSPFIQILCDFIESHGSREDFLSITTRVTNHLKDTRIPGRKIEDMDGNIMNIISCQVPETRSWLAKKLYLYKIKEE